MTLLSRLEYTSRVINTYLFTQQGIRENIDLENWRELLERECALLWVDVRACSEDELETVARLFGLHEVTLESIRDRYRRPHLYEFSDHFYVNLTTVKTGRRGGSISASELHLCAGDKLIITITREKESEAADAALAEYRQTPTLYEKGAIYAVYLLAEDLVETYFPIVEKLDDDADKLEDEMLDSPGRPQLQKLFDLKRRSYELRKFLGPQRDIFNQLTRRDFVFIEGENLVYFQDVYNRMTRIFDMMDTIREILSGNLDIYLSAVSNRLNEIMKVLTIAAVILGVLTFITGFYGMNFKYLPGLKSPYAFWAVTGSMLIIAAGLLWLFRRRRWL